MAGINIYLTEQEQTMLINYVSESVTILGDGEETCEQVEEDMENGLGSALKKLYKGRIGEKNYASYKTCKKRK